MASRPNYPSRQEMVGAQITSTDGTNKVTLIAADADVERKIEVMSFVTNSAANTQFGLYLSDGTNDYQITGLIVYASAGSDGTVAPGNGLDLGDSPWLPNDGGNPYIPLPKGTSLKLAMSSALASGKTLDMMAILTRYDPDA